MQKLKISPPAEDADTVCKNYCSSLKLPVLCITTLHFLYQVMENTKQLKQKVKDVIKRESDIFKDGLCADKVLFANIFPNFISIM